MGLKISNLFKEESDKENNSVEEEFYSISERNYKEEEAQSGSKMILVEPRAYSESQTIADHLKKRNSVVVNLKRVTNEQAKRIIDFLRPFITQVKEFTCIIKGISEMRIPMQKT